MRALFRRRRSGAALRSMSEWSPAGDAGDGRDTCLRESNPEKVVAAAAVV